MLNDTERNALVCLFTLARDGRHATAIRLASAMNVHPTVARDTLERLEVRGLADATAVRLTLNGLAVSVGLGAGRQKRTLRRAA